MMASPVYCSVPLGMSRYMLADMAVNAAQWSRWHAQRRRVM